MRFKLPQFLVAMVMVGALMLTGCTTKLDRSQASISTATETTSSQASETSTTTSETKSGSEISSETIPGMNNFPRLEGKATVVMTVKTAKGEPLTAKTAKGDPIDSITIELDGTNAPVTAGNFVDLVQKQVYDGLVFHRVVREPQPFVVQGGDPQGKNPDFPANRLGTGGYIDPQTRTERYIPLEIKPQGESGIIYSKTFEMAGLRKKPELQHKKGALAMARSQQPDSASSQFYFALADLEFLDGNYAVFGKVIDGFDIVNKIQQGDRIDIAKVKTGIENLKLPQ